MLNETKGSLLDDEQLVNTLQTSKITSQEVSEQLQVSEQTEVKIDAAREVSLWKTGLGGPIQSSKVHARVNFVNLRFWSKRILQMWSNQTSETGFTDRIEEERYTYIFVRKNTI